MDSKNSIAKPSSNCSDGPFLNVSRIHFMIFVKSAARALRNKKANASAVK